MDSKTIFSRTSKGEDEIRSKTAHLSGDIKRSLLMVDGKATFGEINKRAAPSLRSSLEQMFRELIQDGFIQEKSGTGKASRKAVPSGMVPKMIVPSSKASAPKTTEEDEGDIDLDFASEYRAHSQEEQPDEADKAEAEAEAMASALAQMQAKQNADARAEAEEKAEVEAQARAKAEAKARREAEAKASRNAVGEETDSLEVQARALQEARERAEAKARQGAGAQTLSHAEEQARREAEEIAKLEAEAKAKREAEAKARAALIAQERALEAARARVEAEAKSRREAEAKARAEAEAKARREAEAKARAEAEAKARREAEAEARARAEAEERGRREADAEANLGQELEAAGLGSTNLEARTTSATVLFFDVIGYTKQPVNKQIEIKKQFNRLVSDCLEQLGKSERIILDTGDGAAIGFMQHPEDALKVAMQFRNMVTANQHNDYPELKVRIGIHLGPISIVKDMNGLSNMVGDGINDAQRVMSFAGTDQVYISRPYFDFISRLSSEYTSLFHYQGALPDKHGREHPVYKLVAAVEPLADGELLQAGMDALEVKLEPFDLTLPEATGPSASTKVKHSGLGLRKDDVALLNDIGKFTQPDETNKSPAAKISDQSREQEVAPEPEHAEKTAPSPETVGSDTEQRRPSEYEVKKLEEAQAKVWAEAEQRARQASKAKDVWDADLPSEPQPAVKKAAPVARVKRKPFPWYKLAAGMVVAVLLILFVAPFMVPAKEYVPGIIKLLSGKFHQPVYIGRLEGRLLPMPRLDLIDLAIGNDKQIKAKLVRMDFAIPALLTEVKSIDTVELEGVEVDAAALPLASELLQQAAADTVFPIARILLKEGKLVTEGYTLSGVGGELNFNQDGKFSRAKFRAEGNKYEWELVSAPLYKTRVSISVHGSGLPLLPDWVFDDLTAKGEMAGNELMITELDGHIMGGTVHGNARLGWRSGWSAQGSLAAKAITMQNMLKVLSGDMDGTARFQMQSASLAHLADAATLGGSFVIKNGVINGIDIAETARLHRAENMPGGRTHFDELSGDLNYDKGVYAYRNLKLSAGVLAAKGMLDYSGQQAAGLISAELDFHEGIGPVLLELGGTRDNPTLVAR
ncbi:MAG: adenylate/guanylate cyclase domain-containing protein [Pseudomonadota bacterium]